MKKAATKAKPKESGTTLPKFLRPEKPKEAEKPESFGEMMSEDARKAKASGKRVRAKRPKGKKP